MRRRHLTLPTATCLAGSGMLFCLAAMAGLTATGCVTSGCSIYAGYRLMGVSIYGWGALAFCLLALVTFRPLAAKWPERLPYAVVLSALVADSLFLAYQALFWPCLNCLVVAGLIGGIGALSVRQQDYRTGTFKAALGLWLILFSIVSFSAGREVLLKPWAMTGPAQPQATVYFSPTCPACVDMIENLLASSDFDKVAFVPIAKSEEDRKRIEAAQGREGEAAIRALLEPASESERTFRVAFGLWRNKALMAAKGIDSVPVVVASRLPAPAAPSLSGLIPASFFTPAEPAPAAASCSISVAESCD